MGLFFILLHFIRSWWGNWFTSLSPGQIYHMRLVWSANSCKLHGILIFLMSSVSFATLKLIQARDCSLRDSFPSQFVASLMRTGRPLLMTATHHWLLRLHGSHLVCWRSTNQSVVARSSAEAEYRAMANTMAKLLWIHQFLTELCLIHLLCSVTIRRPTTSYPIRFFISGPNTLRLIVTSFNMHIF